MKGIIEIALRRVIREAIDAFICYKIDSECPHCNRPLNLPSEEDIEKWLKGEK